MEITPEVQAQLDEQKKNCPFCKIVAGDGESKKVYEDKYMIGILDINPAVKGHILFLPKEHYPIMPYIPPETFKHMFGLIPKLISAVKKAFLCSGVTVMISNGGIAGQQSPHFLFAMFPRDQDDNLSKFDILKKEFDEKSKEVNPILMQNLPIMLKNHITRNPLQKKVTEVRDDLSDVKSGKSVFYEDEIAICQSPVAQLCNAHIEIIPKQNKHFELLDKESAAHLFFTASFGATAVFEGLKAQGSNILLNASAEGSSIHVLPRFENDDLDFLHEPLKEKPNLDEIKSIVKEEMFMIEYEQKEKKITEVIDLDAIKPIVIGSTSENTQGSKDTTKTEISNDIDEIKQAIKNLQS